MVEVFLNKYFFNGTNSLNSRKEIEQEMYGELEWNMTELVKHRVTKDYNKIQYDKKGQKFESGEGSNIPLAFYIDLSPSMKKYARELAIISLKLLQNNVKVLLGFNDEIRYQINKVPTTIKSGDFIKIFKYDMFFIKRFNKLRNMDIEEVEKKLDNYLIKKKSQKTIILADFDAKEQIEKLSRFSEIYWFCTEEREKYKKVNLENFKGHFFNTYKIEDLKEHLKHLSSKVYEKKQRQERDER